MLTVLAFCALGLIGGAAYLAITPKKYVAASTLIVEQVAAAGAANDDALLDAQAELVTSSDVLRLADRNRELGNLRSLAALTDPIPTVKRNLHAEPSPRRNIITVTYASENREDAVRVVDLVVDAYRSYASDESTRRAQTLRDAVLAGSMKRNDELDQARRALAQFDEAHGTAATNDAATRRGVTLADAADRAQLDTFEAKRAYDDSVADAGPALAGLDDKQLEEALQGSAATVAADSGEIVGQEVLALARQLAELRRTYAENHPAVVRASQRLQQMRLAQVAGTRQRWLAAKAREASLRATIDEGQRINAGQIAQSIQRQRLADEVARARARADELEHQLDGILLSTAAGALSIRVDSPAAVDALDHPPLPRPAPTLATAAAIGLVLGGLFALIGEFREAGSLRHVVPLRATNASADGAGSALRLRVVGNIPSAERDQSDAPRDLARSAQLDPFGPIANAVRSMRVAMEVEGRLPATILLTAAAEKQGTTTVATNLAMTIARESRKVLLIDMNFGSPMAATLLDIDMPHGLIELIEGGEPLALIRPSDVPRLDVLSGGMAPVDAASLLNSDRFMTLLTMLATAYDHVIFDAPPLSRGDDARIVASMCDGTVLISKPTAASLRRAGGARDLLLTIGANLIGVAITRGSAINSDPTTSALVDNVAGLNV